MVKEKTRQADERLREQPETRRRKAKKADGSAGPADRPQTVDEGVQETASKITARTKFRQACLTRQHNFQIVLCRTEAATEETLRVFFLPEVATEIRLPSFETHSSHADFDERLHVELS